MSLPKTSLSIIACAVFTLIAPLASAASVTACKFDRLPLMLLVTRGGMGASDNTLQIGNEKPVPLYVGSSLMNASVGAQSLTFSLRMPVNVSVSAQGADTQTYFGECVGSEL